MLSQACALVYSRITHVRHGSPGHRLARRGLSVLIDLRRLEDAHRQSWLFSVNRFNLFSLHERDFGPNHRAHRRPGSALVPLHDYAAGLAAPYLAGKNIGRIDLLAFPRILGMSFNPVSVYSCYDEDDRLCVIIYEVHNTFGDAHSYLAVMDRTDGPGALMRAEKYMHVSPFFPVNGDYLLAMRRTENGLTVFVRYENNSKKRLTAMLRGITVPMSSLKLLQAFFLQGFLPLRPLAAIHIEAAKLFLKKFRFYRQPAAPDRPVTLAGLVTGHEKIKG